MMKADEYYSNLAQSFAHDFDEISEFFKNPTSISKR